MKNVKTIGLTLALLAIAMMAGSCMFPDYQLSFNVDSITQPSLNTITVNYTLTNIGYQDMKNATILIEVEDTTSGQAQSGWTSPVNLASGSSHYGSLTLYFGGAVTLGTTTAYVVGSGWDTAD